MRKKIDLRKNVCLLGAVIMLGACGQAEKPEQTTAAGTEAQTGAETTAAKDGSGSEDAPEKDSGAKGDKYAEKTEAPKGAEDEKASKEADADKEKDKDTDDKTDKTVKDAETSDGQQAGTDAPGGDGAAAGSASQEETQGQAPTDGQVTDAPASDTQQGGKSVAGIYEEIGQKVALNAPMVVPDDFIANYYGIDVSTLDEYVFSMSEAAISAETVVILKAKDSGSTGTLSAALQTVIDQKRSEMENYLPDQFQIVDKSSVQVQGNYVYLVISEQADAIRQIIQAGIQ